MVNKDIRDNFRRLHGEKKYSKFIIKLFQKSDSSTGLLYWQQKLWNSLRIKYPELEFIDYNEIIEIFSVCPTHDIPLTKGASVILYDKYDSPSENRLELIDYRFPFAEMISFGEREVLFCPTCRKKFYDVNIMTVIKWGI